MLSAEISIIREFFTEKPFFDRYIENVSEGVEVIIPLVHSNELFRNNLFNYYREIPIKRLLISDGGCIDNSIEILKEFPRVEVFDHKNIFSQGYCIRKLIEAVESEWFIYLHSDVYLPKGWMEKMNNYRDKFEWIESKQHQTIMVDFPLPYEHIPERSFSGGQLGKTDILKKAMSEVEDDYLFRTEDIIIADLVKRAKYRYGRTEDVYLHHQEMWRKSPREMQVKFVHCINHREREEEIHTYETMAKSLVKYMEPEDDYVIQTVLSSFQGMIMHKVTTREELEDWVKKTNPSWMHVLFENTQGSNSQTVNSPERAKLKDLQAKLSKLSEMIGKKADKDSRMESAETEAVEILGKKVVELMQVISKESRL